ncbi:YeiH family protein [Acuticoccus sp. I52.16.1]|uniref:YeiH family protein n=1 Tax=Acuticoccus sp. I52.16.1 TaxID=2928472 RepID=UPI001FD29BEA|nr:YeiH family protein [Acuticoccus sp. I52.16.1]UOM35188.1 YeiH family protein [Acuticoccus sp. I52.16.1]
MSVQNSPSTAEGWLQRLRPVAPGLALAAVLAALAMPLAAWSGSPLISPMVLAMVAGIAIRNTVGLGEGMLPGVKVALRPVLRLGIVLLGARLTFEQLGAIGLSGVAVVALALVSTFLFTKAAARVLGVDAKLGELIAAGTSICGASAVLAVNTVTRAHDEDVAYAIACVTVFGSLSMLLFPLLAGPLGFSPEAYGLWVGASVHEVAQAVGGGFALGDVAGETATVAKLGRVILLAPMILILGAVAARRGGAVAGRAPMPWFVFGFVAVVALNSLVAFPAVAVHGAASASTLLLTMALGAMGLETDLAKLRLKGVRPLLLGAVAWVFIAAVTAALVTAA